MEFIELLKNMDNKKIKSLIKFVCEHYNRHKFRKSLDVDYLIISCVRDDIKPEFKKGKAKKKVSECVHKVSVENGISHWRNLITSRESIHNYIEALVAEGLLVTNDYKKYERNLSSLIEDIISNNSEVIERDLNNMEKSEDLLKKIKDKTVKKVIKTYEITAIEDENEISDKDILYLNEYYSESCKANIDKQDNVKKEIREFVDEFKYNKNTDLYIDAPYSVAYYVGKTVSSKSIGNIHPWQKIPSRNFQWFDWRNDGSKCVNIQVEGEGYEYDNGRLNVIISLLSNRNIKNDVIRMQNISKSENILSFSYSNKEIENGGEAYDIANTITRYINQEIDKASQKVDIELYIAAPLTIAYYMGYLSYGIDNVKIYEFIPEEGNKRYELALTI